MEHQAHSATNVNTKLIIPTNTKNYGTPTALALAPQSQTAQIVPPEIVYQIIDNLDYETDLPTIFCIGLTARIYYNYILSRNPGTNELWWYLSERDSLELAPLLEEWMGEKYRRFLPSTTKTIHRSEVYPYTMFLSREVSYAEERALAQRYEDYGQLQSLVGHHRDRYAPSARLNIPYPTGMGMEWYDEMAKVLVHFFIEQWDLSGNQSLSTWFRERRWFPGRKQFWQKYMRSSLRAWVHYKGDHFLGKDESQVQSNRVDSLLDIYGYHETESQWKIPRWTYNGRDNRHRGYHIRKGTKAELQKIMPSNNYHKLWSHQSVGGGPEDLETIYLPEGTSMKEVLKNIERDVEESWGPIH